MIDANSQFFAILTNVGMAKQANADALGIPWKLTEMGVGDANPNGLADPPNPVPSAIQTKLLNEWRRKPLNQLKIDPVNPAVIIAEQIIPADEGGKWLREIGLYDADGDLVAVANCAPSFKPLLSQGSGRTQVVRMNFVVSNTGNITLKIDPAVVLATREYVDAKILDELSKLDIKQSVRAATTANIALSGLQVVDGVSLNAGDRVLVKNQTAAKDNGPYVVAAGAWARAKDADDNAKVTPNLTMAVEVGATQADTIWQLVTDGVIVVGATPLTFKDITDGFARLLSPSFSGNPTAPTPAQFDNSKSIATAEFVKRMGLEYSGFTTNSASLALASSHVGGVHSFSAVGQLTATLPPTVGVAQGATITVVCAGSGGLSVAAAVGDVLYTSSGVTGSILMALGDTAEFIRLQDQWRLIGGTVALRYAAVMGGPNFLTPPQFDSSLRLSTTEFVQRAQGNLRSETAVNSSTTLGANAIGQLIVGLGATPFTTTLPLASSAPSGSQVHFLATNPVSTWIVQRQGADILDNNAGGTYIVLGLGDSAVFESNGAGTWRLVGGSAALRKCADFTSLLLTGGHQKLPSGLIIQWGGGVTGSNGQGTFTLPIIFPNAVLKVFITASGTNSVATLGAVTTNSVGANCYTGSTGAGKSENIQYFAIGF